MTALDMATKRRITRRTVPASWARAARGEMTQEDLARRLDVAVGTVSCRETGKYKVYIETWHAILSACDLPSTWTPGAR